MLRGKKTEMVPLKSQTVSFQSSLVIYRNIQSNISPFFFSGGKWRASQTQTKTGNHKILVTVSELHMQ